MPVIQTAHRRLPELAATGFQLLQPFRGRLDPAEWENLRYLDWSSGGDTNFAVLASALGEENPRGFWEHGLPDKDAVWTANSALAPTLRAWVHAVGARFGRVRIIKLWPSADVGTVVRRCLHLDDNNRLNPEGEGWVVRAWLNLTHDPDSFMILRDDRDDAATEHRIALPSGAQFVVDTERLWHAAFHAGSRPRYALIASFESGPDLQAWMRTQRPSPAGRQEPTGQSDLHALRVAHARRPVD